VTKIIGGNSHSLFPLIKEKKSLSLSFSNIIREDAHCDTSHMRQLIRNKLTWSNGQLSPKNSRLKNEILGLMRGGSRQRQELKERKTILL